MYNYTEIFKTYGGILLEYVRIPWTNFFSIRYTFRRI